MNSILLVIIATFSLVAHAQIIRPLNPMNDARGVVSVEGIDFDYRVIDRGHTTSFDYKDNILELKDIRNFLIRYDNRDKIPSLSKTIGESIMVDVESKCKELGETEAAEFSSKFTNTEYTYSSNITSGQPLVFEDNNAVIGTFVCVVMIQIKQ